MRKGNNTSILNLSYVREVDNNNLLSGELDNLFNLTHPNPLLHKRGKTWIICFFSLLIPLPSHATCTSTPDCASIGYTETSCEGDSLKCPFDISKLYCIPCDSSYRHTCSGDNIVGGVGSACGGKYVICECVFGATFSNGNCVCDTSCSVGNIYYSDGSCSSCVDNSKTAVGIVVKDNELVMSKDKSDNMTWSYAYINVSGIPNSSYDTSKTDYAGKDNTLAIITTHTTENISNNAAIYCNEYAPVGMESSKGQWYLPAEGELYNYVYGNYSIIEPVATAIGKANLFGGGFWSSSENSDAHAWMMNFQGYFDRWVKASKFQAFCFLDISE